MIVGWKLYREVREFAPADWTPAERIVAWVIADDAKEITRISLIDNKLLCHRTGLSERGVRDALQRLAEHGYEFRISHGNDRRGNPVFAARNHPREYRVPPMTTATVIPIRPEGHGSMPPLAVDNSP